MSRNHQHTAVSRRHFLSQAAVHSAGAAALVHLMGNRRFEAAEVAADGHFLDEADIAPAAGVTQTVFVKSAVGLPIKGAKVGVYDDRACYVPKTTDSGGKVTFTTVGGIRTILAGAFGYADYNWSPNFSAYMYTVALCTTPSTKKNTLLSSVSVIARDLKSLMQTFGMLRYVGRWKLKDINFALKTAGIGTGTVCIALPMLSGAPVPEPCKIVGVTLLLANTATWLAQVMGVRDSKQFDFYILTVPTPTILIWPA